MVAVHVEHLELGGLRATQRLQELTYLTGTVGEGEGRGGGVASLGRGAYVFTAARPWLGGRHVLLSARDRLTVRGHTNVHVMVSNVERSGVRWCENWRWCSLRQPPVLRVVVCTGPAQLGPRQSRR